MFGCRRACGLIVATLMVAAGIPAHAQTLDELQKKIDEGRKAQQQKAAPKPASAATARLVLSTDVDCDLRVNGERAGRLVVGEARAVAVKPGQQLIECWAGGVKPSFMAGVEVQAGAQFVGKLEYARVLAFEARFSDAGGGGVRDAQTRLEWTAQDNGRNILWADAQAYCAGKGGGWRLPSMDELLGLYDDTDSVATSCGQRHCKVSSLFRLTAPSFWSSQVYDPRSAWIVDLGNGGTYTNSGSNARQHALCVRRP